VADRYFGSGLQAVINLLQASCCDYAKETLYSVWVRGLVSWKKHSQAIENAVQHPFTTRGLGNSARDYACSIRRATSR